MKDKYNRIWATIDREALRENVLNAKKLAGDAGIIAVVKTDAYGHGVKGVIDTIDGLVAGYAVATADEALELREYGVDKHILILGYVSRLEYDRLVDADITMTIFDYEQAKALSDLALARNHTAKCHIKIDTGMNRIGFPAKSAEDIEYTVGEIRRIRELPMLDDEGIFMHFATADQIDNSGAVRQQKMFEALLLRLEGEGITFKHRHCQNSAAILQMPNSFCDWVRQGITLYGLRPSDEMDIKVPLYPVMSLKSHIVHIKTIHKGDCVSYGATFEASGDMKVATVSAGYGDGYPRSLSGIGYVLIRGEKAPILGRICMDQMMVDVTHIKGVSVEDVVTLMGSDGPLAITAEELGNLSGRFNYEFVCDINKRVPRIFS